MRRNTFGILIIIAVLSLLIAGCATDEAPQNTPTPTPAVQPTPTPAGDPDDTMLPEVEALTGLFPDKENYTWIYSGFVDYGHSMNLDGIEASRDRVIYTITGEVDDPSDGETQRDFSLTLTYTIMPEVVIQKIEAEAIMDSDFDQIELIRLPLEKDNTWMQSVRDKDDREVILESTITDVQQDGDAKVYTVLYQDQDSPYYEKRVLKEGIGVISFERLYITEEDSFEIGYWLYEEASGYK